MNENNLFVYLYRLTLVKVTYQSFSFSWKLFRSRIKFLESYFIKLILWLKYFNSLLINQSKIFKVSKQLLKICQFLTGQYCIMYIVLYMLGSDPIFLLTKRSIKSLWCFLVTISYVLSSQKVFIEIYTFFCLFLLIFKSYCFNSIGRCKI